MMRRSRTRLVTGVCHRLQQNNCCDGAIIFFCPHRLSAQILVQSAASDGGRLRCRQLLRRKRAVPQRHCARMQLQGRWSMTKNQPESAMSARERRAALSPAQDKAFREFSRAVFADGALSRKTKELIAVAVAHVTQCPYCIQGHTRAAAREGASNEEIMEAIWVASEMRAGAAFAHSAIALANLPDDDARKEPGAAS